MKYFLLLLTFAGLQAMAQSNQDFDLQLVSPESPSTTTGGESREMICQVTTLQNGPSVTDNCLPVATMNEVSLNLEDTWFGEEFVKVGHMDLIPLAKEVLTIRATQDNPEEYAFVNDVTPKLPAVMALDEESLSDIMDRFSVLSVRRVATPVGYMEMLEMEQQEAINKYPAYYDEDQRVFRLPIYFNVRWESGVSQGTLQVIAEITLPLLEDMEQMDLPENYSLEDMFRPSVLRFSDTRTQANLGRGIERKLRVISWSTYSQETADEKTLEMLNEVVAPFVGNYLYAVPIQKFIGYAAIEAFKALGNPKNIRIK